MEKKRNKQRILIVDDHPIVRMSLSMLINQEADLEVCGETDEASKVIPVILKTDPAAVILDISLKGESGLEVLKDIKARLPQVKVLMLSMHDELIYAPRAFKAGASGYIMKQQATESVLIALRTILKNQFYVSQRLQHKISLKPADTAIATVDIPSVDQLSDRELEVFSLIGLGIGTREIAAKLNVSTKTIETYRAHIKTKFKLQSATQLVHCAVQHLSAQRKCAR